MDAHVAWMVVRMLAVSEACLVGNVLQHFLDIGTDFSTMAIAE